MPENTYHHGDLKTQLIREGLTLLNAEGYEGFSLRKVAARCGVSQTAPYRHFKNKDDLIGAITEQAFEAFAQVLKTAVAQHEEPIEQLREMGVTYVRFFAKHPEYLRLLFLSDIRLKQMFSKRACDREHIDSFRILRDTIDRCVKAYPEAPYSGDEMMIFSWGLVHGISTLIAAGELPDSEDVLSSAERVIRHIG